MYINNYTISSAIGEGINETLSSLQNAKSGIMHYALDGFKCTVGSLLPKEDIKQSSYKNNRLIRIAEKALKQDDFTQKVLALKNKYPAHRIGLIIGTISPGALATENIFLNNYKSQKYDPDNFFPADYVMRQSSDYITILDFIREYFEILGISYVISTSCSSSAKAFIDAEKLITANLCDAVLVGGIETPSHILLHGFNSLGLLSEFPCKPFDIDRDGISIGEAAAFAIIEKERDKKTANSIKIIGSGESTDGYHMVSPHPEGKGIELAINKALKAAQLKPDDIEYINMHGTATPFNDQIEDQIINKIFTNKPHCSSTKGYTGHTMGACGIVETIISALALTHDFMPQSLGITNLDPELKSNILTHNLEKKFKYALTNSFGFGGNNVSLVLEKITN